LNATPPIAVEKSRRSRYRAVWCPAVKGSRIKKEGSGPPGSGKCGGASQDRRHRRNDDTCATAARCLAQGCAGSAVAGRGRGGHRSSV